MRRAQMLGLALGLAALTGAVMTTSASAQWRDNDRHSRSRSWNRSGDFEGVWRLEGGRGGRLSDRFVLGPRLTRLPESFRIETARRILRIEDMRGRLIEQVRVASRYGNHFEIRRGGRDGTVVQRFALESRGRRLVVRTTIEGRRGEREFTQVYDRVA